MAQTTAKTCQKKKKNNNWFIDLRPVGVEMESVEKCKTIQHKKYLL